MFNIQTHMDFAGQGQAEHICRFIITLFGIVGFVWGAIIQQFSQTVFILLAGCILAGLITIPPWPMYRRHPLTWQKPRPEPSNGNSSGDESGKKKKK